MLFSAVGFDKATGRPARRPRRPSESADASSSQPCGGPEVVGRRAVAIMLFAGARQDRGQASATRDADVQTICACPASYRRRSLHCFCRRHRDFTRFRRSHAEGCAQDLRRYRARCLRRLSRHPAHASSGASLDTARTSKPAGAAFLATPTEDNLRGARAAWIAARIPYMQTEAFRFGNTIVDDWEGRVNFWPLDEGLIDYVSASYGIDSAENDLYTANVVANKTLIVGGKKLDTSKITKELLADHLQEAGGVEANIATGYHAIEFLLWGQDLNGTDPGNGNRPASDYDLKKCSNGNCERRAEYLRTATDLLVDDLAWMAAQWELGGDARKHIMDGGDEAGLTAIMTGLGSLSYGELAGERMKLGLMIHDPEEEQDCFSDNTHASHFFDALGIRNVYLGTYRRADRSLVTGASISDLVKAK